jgi:hypothetical protein
MTSANLPQKAKGKETEEDKEDKKKPNKTSKMNIQIQTRRIL